MGFRTPKMADSSDENENNGLPMELWAKIIE
jgi:hypothetical protein